MKYSDRLVSQYYSTHYNRIMPKTIEGWQSIVERFDLNFGNFLSLELLNDLVLDLPCGVGYLEYYLLRKGFTDIHAVDLSEEQIQVAKGKLQEYGLEHNGKIVFHISDAFEFLKRSEGYRLIAVIDFLEHLDKDRVIEFLDLANGAMQNGGLLFIRVVNADNPMWGRNFYRDFTHQTPFTPDTLRQCLNITEFDVIKIDYEAIPKSSRFISRIKHKVQWMGRLLLGRFYGIPPEAFAENLVAVGRKKEDEQGSGYAEQTACILCKTDYINSHNLGISEQVDPNEGV